MSNWEKKFDKKFPGWKNTKLDWETGEVEYVKVGGDEEIKHFIEILMIKTLDELKTENKRKYENTYFAECCKLERVGAFDEVNRKIEDIKKEI